jgi:hypothetical protein
MKKYTLLSIGLILSFALISWGYEGHYVVAAIAENHLTPNAKAAVKELLGKETLADVSSYADEIKSDPSYDYTKPWHYINLPLGMDYSQFQKYVLTDKEPNIYSNLLIDIEGLKHPENLKAESYKQRLAQQYRLKLIVHLVGDAHQPMHVSRAEDKGGNATSVTFLGGGTNLHSLWDSGLLDHQKTNYKDLAAKYDDATPEQIKKWQSDNVMVWLWESYQITTILYKEAADNPNFDEKYYQDHLPILKSRIEKAGIRLAGILNDIYK